MVLACSLALRTQRNVSERCTQACKTSGLDHDCGCGCGADCAEVNDFGCAAAAVTCCGPCCDFFAAGVEGCGCGSGCAAASDFDFGAAIGFGCAAAVAATCCGLCCGSFGAAVAEIATLIFARRSRDGCDSAQTAATCFCSCVSAARTTSACRCAPSGLDLASLLGPFAAWLHLPPDSPDLVDRVLQPMPRSHCAAPTQPGIDC